MLRPRLSNPALSEAAGNRPRWLTNGVVNVALLCVLIVLVGMLSPRLSRTDAGITFFVGLGAFALAASSFIGLPDGLRNASSCSPMRAQRPTRPCSPCAGSGRHDATRLWPAL